MNFFARQEAARRQSRWLFVTYVIAVLCVIGGIDLVAVLLLSNVDVGDGEPMSPGSVAVVCTVLVGGLILVATTYKILMLRGGGGVVARDMGGARVDPSTRDPLRRRLINVVEEMAIASGVPAPEVYVLENETAINAFSAGHSPANAAIAVTAGMLRRLNREQLQAVVAHEFSHVLNGDMRLSIRLMGLNFGLLVLMLAGRVMLHASGGRSSRRGKGGGGIVAIALALLVLGYLGQVFGRLLQAMISRQREHLADASAVQFTRNPEGLKAALLRAAAQRVSTRLQAVDAEEVAHMLFLSSGRRVFATHPPTIDRLRALDPSFTEQRMRDEIVGLQKRWDEEESANRAEDEPRGVAREVADDLARGTGLAGVLTATAVAAGIAQSVGDPQPEHVRRAHLMHESLPDKLTDVAGSAARSRALVLALLLSTDGAVRDRQFQLLAASGGGTVAGEVRAESALAAALSPEQRLPAVLQLFPALRQLPSEEQRDLQLMLMRLAAADRRIDVFEFSLGKLIAVTLGESLRPGPAHGKAPLDQRLPQLALLFAVLARHGADTDAEARRAYAAGVSRLLGSRWPDFDCPDAWAAPLASALDDLRELQPAGKELLIEAMVATIGYDGRVTVEEGELLRTVGAVLQCPVPPLLPGEPGAGRNV